MPKQTIKILKFVGFIVILAFAISMMKMSFMNVIEIATKPDTRTVEQVEQDTYKDCLIRENARNVVLCKNYLK